MVAKPFSLLSIALICLMVSCAVKKPNNEIVSIKHGSSFGMCNGYCFNEYTYSESSSVKFSKGWGRTDLSNYPDKYDTTEFSNKEWEELILKLDSVKFFALPEIIGCPDCADGGAEWIEVATKEKTVKVTFEFSNDVPEISALLSYLRTIEKK
jgi:hypothetical protein